MENVLFVLKVPPPVHGSTLMNQIVMQSQFIRNSFNTTYFPLSISKDVNDVGKFSFRKVGKILRDYVRLHKIVKEAKPSLVYFAVSPSGMALFKDFLFFMIIRRKKIPVIFHHHGKGITWHGSKSRIYNWVYTRMLSESDNICLAKELTSDLSKYVKREPFVVFNAIQEDYQKGKLISKNSERVKILYLSNFTKSKGILEVIEAARLLKDRKLNFKVSLVGKPFDISEEELTLLITKYGLTDYVKLLGPAYGEAKFAIIREHDFLVFPTFYEKECLPLVIIEAMQGALPVISTYEGGIPSLIENHVNGFLVEKHDTEGLANKMEYLIRNPEKMKEMGRVARENYEAHFTLEKFELSLVETLNTILKNTPQNT